MEGSSFYMTLPSNACMDIHPTNKQSSFKVQLPRTLYLNNSYEVGLAEIHYPTSWRTMTHDISHSFLVLKRPSFTPRRIFIAQGYYQTMSELIRKINKTLLDHFGIEKTEDKIKLTVVASAQKIMIEATRNMFIKFPDELCDVLGLEHGKYYGDADHDDMLSLQPGQSYGNAEQSPFRYDITRGFYSLFVYCNICEPQVVGNVYAPLLRAVEISGKRGEHIMKSYGEPHYIQVCTKQIDSIEINIKDDTGEFVPFMFGKVVCKLHFRQRSQ